MSLAPDQPNVLLIRLSAIGDIVMASGLPSSIKNAMPDAKVTWLVESPYAELVSHHPYVDNVICWPKKQWQELAKKRAYWSLIKSFIAFRKTLASCGFTHAIDAQGLLKSALLAYLSGAKMRIGFNSKEHSQLFLSEGIDKPISNLMSSEYRRLAQRIGSPRYSLLISMSTAASQNAQSILTLTGVSSNYIVLAPFTTRPQKHWPQSHWKQLIKLIRHRSTMPVVILGGPNDVNSANALTAHAPNVFSLAGHLSLAESACIVNTCIVFIGVDTGLTHMAIAYHRPTLALFGSTCPYTQTDNKQTHVLYKGLSCGPCKRKPTCHGKYDCMNTLTPSEVDSVLKEYL